MAKENTIRVRSVANSCERRTIFHAGELVGFFGRPTRDRIVYPTASPLKDKGECG